MSLHGCFSPFFMRYGMYVYHQDTSYCTVNPHRFPVTPLTILWCIQLSKGDIFMDVGKSRTKPYESPKSMVLWVLMLFLQLLMISSHRLLFWFVYCITWWEVCAIYPGVCLHELYGSPPRLCGGFGRCELKVCGYQGRRAVGPAAFLSRPYNVRCIQYVKRGNIRWNFANSC